MAYTTINDPTDYFNIVLYTGNASTPTNITGVGFQPDWVWIKNRSASENHILADAVRGANKLLESNTADAELSDSNYIKAFQSDGFQIGSEGAVNGNSNGIVSWNWKANGQGSSNTNGSINTTYTSANTTAGFSIVAFTGTGSNATVGHGLGVTPSMIIVKNLSVTQEWAVYHASLGATKYLELNLTGASGTASNRWNNTSPTNSVFSVGSDASVNGSSNNIIAYCFAEKQGYSKFGSYTGNGNADGTFVYTGFRVGWLMIKNTSTGSTKWTICDSKRDGFNDNNHRLFASETEAESTSNPWEMYSNGFKMTTTGSFVNASGSNYIYMAFAEHPFTSSTGTPVTAR